VLSPASAARPRLRFGAPGRREAHGLRRQTAEPQVKSAGTSEKPAATAAAIAGTVALAPALQGKVAPTDTVYIFARAAEGPRMPLAILRKQVRDLPVSFRLDDSMAMTPNLALSNFADIVVGARVSKSGNATPQSGDLEGVSAMVKVGASGVSIVIDRALP
jgi:cytochrome c-type biogenesis protein CcmH